MTDDITLAGLEQELLEAETNLGAAKREVLDNPGSAGRLADCRSAVELAKDRIEAFKIRERERAAAEAERVRLVELKECETAATAAHKAIGRYGATAEKLDQAIDDVAGLRRELDREGEKVLELYRKTLPPDLDWEERNRLLERLPRLADSKRLITSKLDDCDLVAPPPEPLNPLAAEAAARARAAREAAGIPEQRFLDYFQERVGTAQDLIKERQAALREAR